MKEQSIDAGRVDDAMAALGLSYDMTTDPSIIREILGKMKTDDFQTSYRPMRVSGDMNARSSSRSTWVTSPSNPPTWSASCPPSRGQAANADRVIPSSGVVAKIDLLPVY